MLFNDWLLSEQNRRKVDALAIFLRWGRALNELWVFVIPGLEFEALMILIKFRCKILHSLREKWNLELIILNHMFLVYHYLLVILNCWSVVPFLKLILILQRLNDEIFWPILFLKHGCSIFWCFILSTMKNLLYVSDLFVQCAVNFLVSLTL